MLDFVKKSMHVGLGLAVLTKEKVEAVAKEMAQQAKLSEEEGRKLADYLEQESAKARENLKTNVDSLVLQAMAKLPCEKKLAALEARLAVLEKAAGIAPPGCCPGCADDNAPKAP